MEGEAFDLLPGDDIILQPRVRDYISDYFTVVKPGLTIISAPCTMFSMLQNLNQHRWEEPEHLRKHARRLGHARTLLRFAVKVIDIIRSYGGKYAFEQPLCSKAWLEKELQTIIHQDDTMLVRTDQCQFNLKSSRGGQQPTGWMTNSVGIKTRLDRQCRGQHEHEHVTGSQDGMTKSRRSQEYPRSMVTAIVQGYKDDLRKKGTELNFIDNQDIQKLEIYDHYHLACLEKEFAEVEQRLCDEEPWAVYTAETLDEEQERHVKRYLPRERPFSLPTLVQRAHEGLGHSNDRLAPPLQRLFRWPRTTTATYATSPRRRSPLGPQVHQEG